MEPVRGGKLANLPAAAQEKLHALRPEATDASWALRWVQEIPGVTMILSGMSNMAQMQDNLATFDHPEPLSAEEQALLLEIAEGFKSAVPCTACRYCCERLPQEIDIPADAACFERASRRAVHERDHGGRSPAEEPEAAKLPRLRRMRGSLSAEDRHSGLHAGADGAHREAPELG